MYLELGSSSVWWYPSRNFIFEKYFALLSSGNMSSSFGIWCLSLIKLSFARLISRQILIAPFDLGTATIGFIQLGGPSTLSIQSFSINLVISLDTFLRVC